MTRDDAKQLLPIIEAFANGETIEMRLTGGDWVGMVNPNFQNIPANYRIKPKPRTYYLLVDKDGRAMAASNGVAHPNWDNICLEGRASIIKTIEVID